MGMMVGCARGSEAGVHRTCDSKTGKTCNTKHVKWKDVLCGDCVKQGGNVENESSDSEDSDDESSIKWREKGKEEKEKNDDKEEDDEIKERMMEKMKQMTQDVDLEQLVDRAKGVRTRSQRAKNMDHMAGGIK